MRQFNPLDVPDPNESDVDRLRSLCEKQRTEIERLRKEYSAAETRLATVANELLQASADRKAELQNLLASVANLGAETKRAFKQRDTVEKALRALVAVCQIRLKPARAVEQVEEYNRTVAEAVELLTLIDQAKQK